MLGSGRMPGKVLARWRVLVVEDQYFLANDMQRALQAAAATVVGPVPTLAQAARIVRTEQLDAAVLDVNLRGQPVFPIMDMLMARGVPFALMTGYGRWAIPAAYRDLPRMEKPVAPRRIVAVLAGLRAGPAAVRDCGPARHGPGGAGPTGAMP